MKQYAIATTHPDAGNPEWHAQMIGFHSKGAAVNSMNGTIDALTRSGSPISKRQWAIVEFDMARMIPAGPLPFLARVVWAVKYVFSGHKFHIAGMDRTEFKKWQAAAERAE